MYRRFRTPSIYRELIRMQEEMNELFKGAAPKGFQKPASFPAINIWSDEGSAFITAEIPGVDKDDLDISVTGDTLTISGNRKPEDVPAEAQYHRRERNLGEFNRSIQLPYTVDVNKVKAEFSHGILRVDLPRIEAEKPKKISVKTS